MAIVNVGYASTNYYAITAGRSYLLVDVGFPGTLPKLRHTLERAGITLRAVEHLFATHYHPDHAGLAPELQREGVRLIVLEPQLPSIPRLGQYMKPEHRFQPIALADCLVSSLAESRSLLRRLGLAGEMMTLRVGAKRHRDAGPLRRQRDPHPRRRARVYRRPAAAIHGT
jgi:ribonuclease/clavin/mitogillin